MDFEKYLKDCADSCAVDQNDEIYLFEPAFSGNEVTGLERAVEVDSDGDAVEYFDSLSVQPPIFVDVNDESSVDDAVKICYGSVEAFVDSWFPGLRKWGAKGKVCTGIHVPPGDSLLSSHKCEERVIEVIKEVVVQAEMPDNARIYLNQVKDGCDSNTANVIRMLLSGSKAMPQVDDNGDLWILDKSDKWMKVCTVSLS